MQQTHWTKALIPNNVPQSALFPSALALPQSFQATTLPFQYKIWQFWSPKQLSAHESRTIQNTVRPHTGTSPLLKEHSKHRSPQQRFTRPLTARYCPNTCKFPVSCIISSSGIFPWIRGYSFCRWAFGTSRSCRNLTTVSTSASAGGKLKTPLPPLPHHLFWDWIQNFRAQTVPSSRSETGLSNRYSLPPLFQTLVYSHIIPT